VLHTIGRGFADPFGKLPAVLAFDRTKQTF
jgi:hypothetical protein